MKKTAAIILAAVLLLTITACGQTQTPTDISSSAASAENGAPAQNTERESQPAAASGILVAYFSATGHTAPIAAYAADILGAELYEIKAKQPYTEADLAYNTGGRCDREQADPNARPEIDGKVENMAQYGVVLIGHPIWHGQAPRIVSTFLESYDFADKTLVTFCTSASSGLGSSANDLHGLVPASAEWLESRRFAIGSSKEEVNSWLTGIGLAKNAQAKEMKIQVTADGRTMTATLADNPSAEAFYDLLNNGPVTVAMQDYGNFEKVGPLGTDIVRSDETVTTTPGDIILYQGSQVTIYYDVNTWDFTPLGHIDGATGENMRAFLGEGNVTVQFRIKN